MTITSTPARNESGFTLVELAIVLMIIGLLIGGILRGQELMENARVTSTIQQTKAYDGATTTFRDAYAALPGDIVNPSTRLANCAAAPCNATGNGNGIVAPSAGTATTTLATYPITGENHTFWVHMATTHLISGVDPSSPVGTNSWGTQFPAGKIAGGFQVVSLAVPAGANNPALSGLYLVLAANPNAGSFNGTAGQNAISALRAAQIDRKLDDGLPQTGDVIGIGSGTNCTGVTSGTAITYGETDEQKNCNLLIRAQN
ncbi:MAG: prepilin-type N-terminal cleavage/methylation domain protein [Alphaproteobacteria bacterium]|nr:prepilin-type N-terminal cleavage/methylation domain protein [Alphaproteobacteria bacterium]